MFGKTFQSALFHSHLGLLRSTGAVASSLSLFFFYIVWWERWRGGLTKLQVNVRHKIWLSYACRKSTPIKQLPTTNKGELKKPSGLGAVISLSVGKVFTLSSRHSPWQAGRLTAGRGITAFCRDLVVQLALKEGDMQNDFLSTAT